MLVDFLREIFRRLDISAAFVPVALADHEDALRRGTADAVAFKAIVPEFEAIYDFSAPLLISGGAWFRQNGVSAAEFDPPAGARIVTPGRGPMLGVVRRDYPHLVVSAVDSYADALAAVAAGEADAAALNFHIAGHLARRDYPETIAVPPAPFAPQPIAFCVLKNRHGDLLKAFDRALAQSIREGVREQIQTRWLGETHD